LVKLAIPCSPLLRLLLRGETRGIIIRPEPEKVVFDFDAPAAVQILVPGADARFDIAVLTASTVAGD
jgi:hypothetical protein